MCMSTPNIPAPPPPPPPPPPMPQFKPPAVGTDPAMKASQRNAARLGTNQLVIPLSSSINIPS